MLKQLPIIGVLLLILGVSFALPATKFVGEDNKTGGDWSQKYGQDGYIFCNVKGPQGTAVNGGVEVKKNDIAKLPGYIKDYTLGGGIGGYVWQAEDNKPKILKRPDEKQTAACWFTSAGDFTVDFPLKYNTAYKLAVYIDDWESGGRNQTMMLKDLDTGAELATHDYADYGAIGKYGIYEVDKSVQLFVHHIAGSYGNAVISGVFFYDSATAVNKNNKLTATWSAIKNH